MRILLLMASAGIYMAAIGWPLAALIWLSVSQGTAPREGFWFSHGQILLLVRTVGMAGGAVLLSLPLALVTGVATPLRRGSIFLLIIAAGLLCPPMVYAFGWLRLLPSWVPAELRCILTWTVWLWPLAAVLIGAGWTRTGKEAFEAALLSTNPASAFLRIGLPALLPYICLASLLLFVLLLSDYGVPHSFGLRVYSTELLAWASESDHTVDVLWPALLPAALTAGALGLMFAVIQGWLPGEGYQQNVGKQGTRWGGLFLLLVAAGWLLPLAALSSQLSAAIFAEALRTYKADLGVSLLVASLAVVLILLLGVGFHLTDRFWKGALFVAVLFGALPGAVVGQALIAAYNRPFLYWVYDYWPIVSLAYVSRYAWIGMLVFAIAARSRTGELADQARTDGATELQTALYVLLPQHASLLLGAAAIVVALAMGDVATSSLVRVPGYSPIAHVVIEKFHRLEDGMLISLSLMLVGVAGLGAAVAAWALGKARD